MSDLGQHCFSGIDCVVNTVCVCIFEMRLPHQGTLDTAFYYHFCTDGFPSIYVATIRLGSSILRGHRLKLPIYNVVLSLKIVVYFSKHCRP